MKVIVTGAAGFIGSRLAKALRSEVEEVIGVDPRWGPMVTRQGIASEECGGESVDALFHCGGMIDVGQCERDPIGAYEANVTESLRLSRRVTVRQAFVYTSSYATLTPDANIYGKVKLEADFWLSKGLKNYASVLLPNVMGVGGSGVVSRFMFTRDPVMYGGSQTREFAYIDDVVDKLIAVGLTPQLGRHAIGGYRVTIAELARMIGRQTAPQPMRSFEVVDPPTFVPTWKAPTTLEEGLRRMVKEAEATGMTYYYNPPQRVEEVHQ